MPTAKHRTYASSGFFLWEAVCLLCYRRQRQLGVGHGALEKNERLPHLKARLCERKKVSIGGKTHSKHYTRFIDNNPEKFMEFLRVLQKLDYFTYGHNVVRLNKNEVNVVIN